MNITASILIAVVLTIMLCVAAHVVIVRRGASQSRRDRQRINELELKVHAVERQFGKERNLIESAHHATLAAEQKKMAELHMTHAEALVREREKVTDAVMAQARRDFEAQASLFAVAVKPYVKVLSDDGLFSSSHESQIGYQYQLLINGIPAFQPHIVIESTESTKTFNDEKLKELIKLATIAAEAAIVAYAGGPGRNISLAQAIVEKLPKK